METKSRDRKNETIQLMILIFFIFSMFLIYSPVFTTDYLMNDEFAEIGRSRDIRSRVLENFFVLGRGLFGFFNVLIYRFAGFDTNKILIVRMLNFLSNLLVGVYLLKFSRKQFKNSYLAFYFVLFFMSQIPVQALFGYSFQFFTNSQPALWLSLISYHIHFFENKTIKNTFIRYLVVFSILFIAMQFLQSMALFSLVPLSYLILSKWEKVNKRIWLYLISILSVILVSTFLYKVGSSYWEQLNLDTYIRGETLVETISDEPLRVFLSAINPLSYWSAFHIWNYPVLIEPIWGLKIEISKLILIIWLGIISIAALLEYKNKNDAKIHETVGKYLAWLVSLVLTLAPIIADAPLGFSYHRGHILLPFVGVVLFSTIYALQIIIDKVSFLKNPIFVSLVILGIIINAFGAYRSVKENLVGIRANQIDFIRSEAIENNVKEFKTIVVILPQKSVCKYEPCLPFFGYEPHSKGHLSHPNGYMYALSTLGFPPDSKDFVFIEEAELISFQEVVIIDWNKYVNQVISN